jgi:hypothetical protein
MSGFVPIRTAISRRPAVIAEAESSIAIIRAGAEVRDSTKYEQMLEFAKVLRASVPSMESGRSMRPKCALHHLLVTLDFCAAFACGVTKLTLVLQPQPRHQAGVTLRNSSNFPVT